MKRNKKRRNPRDKQGQVNFNPENDTRQFRMPSIFDVIWQDNVYTPLHEHLANRESESRYNETCGYFASINNFAVRFSELYGPDEEFYNLYEALKDSMRDYLNSVPGSDKWSANRTLLFSSMIEISKFMRDNNPSCVLKI